MSNSSDEKVCKKCDVAKPKTQFSPAKTNRDKLSSWCRPCAARYAAEKRTYDPLLSRRNALKSKYGLTLEQYDEMLDAQGGACAICKAPPVNTPLHVDHDHSCCPGRITCGKCLRSLLCTYCNNFLGKLEHPNLNKYLEYMKRWSNE